MAKKKKRTTIQVKWDIGSWWVILTSSTGRFDTKAIAVKRARKVARGLMPSQLKIYKKNGKFQTKHTYSDDPRRSKG